MIDLKSYKYFNVREKVWKKNIIINNDTTNAKKINTEIRFIRFLCSLYSYSSLTQILSILLLKMKLFTMFYQLKKYQCYSQMRHVCYQIMPNTIIQIEFLITESPI